MADFEKVFNIKVKVDSKGAVENLTQIQNKLNKLTLTGKTLTEDSSENYTRIANKNINNFSKLQAAIDNASKKEAILNEEIKETAKQTGTSSEAYKKQQKALEDLIIAKKNLEDKRNKNPISQMIQYSADAQNQKKKEAEEKELKKKEKDKAESNAKAELNAQIEASGMSDIYKKLAITKDYLNKHAADFKDNDAERIASLASINKKQEDILAVGILKQKAVGQRLIGNEENARKNEIAAKNIEKNIPDFKEASSNKGFKKDFQDILKKNSPKTKLEDYKKGYNTIGGAFLGKSTEKISENFQKQMKAVISKIGTFFTDIFKNAINKLSEMATYNAGTSLISNSTNRERQLTFGLTSGQNYAMTTAMDALGMQSTDDLLWMNTAQASKYQELTATLEAQYDKLESTGVFDTVQEFQIDFKMFKTEFTNTIYQFIADHKTELEAVLKLAMNFMNGILTFVGWIVDALAGITGNAYAASDNASVSSSTSTTSNTDNTKNTNMVVNYTNNGSNGTKDSASAVSSEVLNQIKQALDA